MAGRYVNFIEGDMKGAIVATLKIAVLFLFFALWVFVTLFVPKRHKGH